MRPRTRQRDLKRQAADSAQTVAETAKTEAANVAAEVKTNARDLLHQAKSDLTDQAGTQQQKVAEGLRSVSTELHAMAAASEQPGVATDLVRQAAERSSAVAGWLDGRDPGSLLTEVKSFARQRPGTFLLLAAGAGVLAGRLSRSLSAGAPETGATGAARPLPPGSRTPAWPFRRRPCRCLPRKPRRRASLTPTRPIRSTPIRSATRGRQDRWAAEPVVTDPPGRIRSVMIPLTVAVDDQRNTPHRRARQGGDIVPGRSLGEVTRDMSTLMRQEVELAKVELKQSATRAGRAAGMLAGAGVAGHFVLLFLSLALWWALGTVMGLGWSGVVVAVIWGIVAAVLAPGAARNSTRSRACPRPPRRCRKSRPRSSPPPKYSEETR